MDKRVRRSVWDWLALAIGFAAMAVGVLLGERLPPWTAYVWPPLVLLGLVGAVRILWRAMDMGSVQNQGSHPPATAISDEVWEQLVAEEKKREGSPQTPEEADEA